MVTHTIPFAVSKHKLVLKPEQRISKRTFRRFSIDIIAISNCSAVVIRVLSRAFDLHNAFALCSNELRDDYKLHYFETWSRKQEAFSEFSSFVDTSLSSLKIHANRGRGWNHIRGHPAEFEFTSATSPGWNLCRYHFLTLLPLVGIQIEFSCTWLPTFPPSKPTATLHYSSPEVDYTIFLANSREFARSIAISTASLMGSG